VSTRISDAALATYTNPVYPQYFADPFVLEVDGRYYAYGTGQSSFQNGRVFEVLESDDLVHWQSLGGALEPLGVEYRDYWAPEVARHDGRFYMYYSAGVGDAGHRLRVAVSDHPEGPFVDSGVVLTGDDPFSIDANPFQDDDGHWYLFYARDFLEGERVGTALAVDRLSDMTRLSGQPTTVLRASNDWQLYARDRPMYGGVHDWHTLEGPFVVKRGGRYYCFYSGGAWPEPSYGVSYAVADHPLGPWHEPQADGPTVLRTIPGRVIGPGHNSVVTGPDGRDYLVYHAWDVEKTGRRMCIDALEWTPEGPVTSGPSSTPRAAPRSD
jgi:beta-xylosidase